MSQCPHSVTPELLPAFGKLGQCQWISLASRQGEDCSGVQVAAHSIFGPNQRGEREMEASSAEPASVSEPAVLHETSASAFSHPRGQDPTPAGNAAEAAIMEEQGSEMVLAEEEMEGLHPRSSEESAGQASVFTSLSFPQKLWVLAESEDVKSVWWGLGGNCLVIEEEPFLVEVLSKEGPMRAFGCTSIKSFVRQLNYYGFAEVSRAMERSPSLPEFLAEEELFATDRKLLLYSSPFFRRQYPSLLQHCQRRAARKRSATAGPGPALQETRNDSPPRSSPGAHATWGAAVMLERSPEEAEPAATQPAASVGPLPAKRPKKETPRAPAGPAHSLAGPAATPVPEQYQAQSCSVLPLDSSLMLDAARAPAAHGARPFVEPTVTLGPPQQELPQAPETAQLQAPWAAMPLLSACFAVAMAAIAKMMPPGWQPWAAPHCSTCACGQHQAAPHCPTCTCSQYGADAALGKDS